MGCPGVGMESPQWEVSRKGKPGCGTQCRAPVATVGMGHRLDVMISQGSSKPMDCVIL